MPKKTKRKKRSTSKFTLPIDTKSKRDYWQKSFVPKLTVREVTEAESIAYHVFRMFAPTQPINPATVVQDALKLLKPESNRKSAKSKKKKAKNALPVRRTRT